ncbi:N-acetylmuramoyl-L-alanine amidase [Bradyrhizobium sp. USDA 4454]
MIVVAIAMFALLPIEAGDAGWLPDLFKTSSKQAKAPKRAKSVRQATRPGKSARKSASHRAPAKPGATRLAALGPIALPPSAPKPAAAACDPATFRIVLDVGHTAESEGAISARNVAEFIFNRRLARVIEERLKADGFAETRLLLTEGKARPSLFKRVASASNLHADLLLSIHHDSVPNKMLEDWEFEGRKSHFSDRFSGYSVFVSRENPDFRTSLRFAELVAKEMKAGGLHYAEQYSLPVMGSNQHPLLNKDTGVYSYDELIVLRKTAMPAVLLEAGSIINRDEELAMDSPERRNIIAGGVAAAVKEFCDPRWALLGPL